MNYRMGVNPKKPEALPGRVDSWDRSAIFQSKSELFMLRISVGAHVTFKKPFAGRHAESVGAVSPG